MNKLKFAPSCIALFDKPFPPDFDYDAQVLHVELPTEVPPNGGPGLAAIHEIFSGPSHTVDVPVRAEPQAAAPETSDAPNVETAPVQPAQAFTLYESSGSNPRIVTIKGARPRSYTFPLHAYSISDQ